MIIGLNKLLKKKFPNEQRSLMWLQVSDDQTGCLWFITGDQRQKLCPLIHSLWSDKYHFCEVTHYNWTQKSYWHRWWDILVERIRG